MTTPAPEPTADQVAAALDFFTAAPKYRSGMVLAALLASRERSAYEAGANSKAANLYADGFDAGFAAAVKAAAEHFDGLAMHWDALLVKYRQRDDKDSIDTAVNERQIARDVAAIIRTAIATLKPEGTP
jgi:flagellar biosynthesis/type III secretory pathway protein FliH